jgi:hypothetical protein
VPLALLLAFAAVIGATLLLHKFVAPPGARIVIAFDARSTGNARAILTRGQLSAQTLRFVQDVLRESGATHGTVAVLPTGKLWFSPTVPESAHQRLRNILMA